VCAGLILGLALLETTFALVRTGAAAPRIWPPHLRRTFAPRAEWIPGVEGLSRFETSSLGLRGDEPAPGDYRILALGGSTTECLYLDQEEAWPARVQAILRRGGVPAWVGNGGRSGHSTREHRVQFGSLAEMVEGLDAVLLLAGINDLGLRLAAGEHYDPQAMSQPEAFGRVASRAFARSQFAQAGPFYKRTALYALARTVHTKTTAAGQDEAGAVYARWREHRRLGTREEHLPDLTSGLDEYRANLIECARLARRDGVRLILMTQPVLWRKNLPAELEALLWMGGIGDYQKEMGSIYYTSAALAEGMQRYNECLLQLSREIGVECLDLAGLLADDTAVFYDDCHFNESGARKVAEAVAAYLLESAPPGTTAESR
jgi:lysophospholipase L1-like esterase